MRTIGYIPGEIAFFDRMTGTAFLNFLSEMRMTKDRSRVATLLELFQMDLSERIRKMSKRTK